MAKNIIIIVIGGVIVLLALSWFYSRPDSQPADIGDETAEQTDGEQATSTFPAKRERATIEDIIVVDAPLTGEAVSSPLSVRGAARGFWFFEATAPVRIEDAEGTVIAQSFVTAQGEWTSEDFVSFSGSIIFGTPVTEAGELVIENANPSGLPEQLRTLRIPITFR